MKKMKNLKMPVYFNFIDASYVIVGNGFKSYTEYWNIRIKLHTNIVFPNIILNEMFK